MEDRIDLLTVNRNTLPFLKLLVHQIEMVKPRIPIALRVWDNASTDGSVEWLTSSGIFHYLHQSPGSHVDGLKGLLRISSATYAAFIDVDAVPIKDGWLDDAIEALKKEKVGIAGLSATLIGPFHKKFVHPSFCVFRRDLYNLLNLDPSIVHDSSKTLFDVGEVMCSKLEEAGYSLEELGPEYPHHSNLHKNKVIHMRLSWQMLCNTLFPKEAVRDWVQRHRALLATVGLWDEFIGYIKESCEANPLCLRYLEN